MSLETNNDDNCQSRAKVELIHKTLINYWYDESLEISFEELLQKEGDINHEISEDFGGATNLLHAVYHRGDQCKQQHKFDLLLNFGVDFTYKNRMGQTVVHSIIRDNFKRNYFSCEYFVNSVISAHIKFLNVSNPSDDNGITHFHAACMTDNAEAIEFFLKNGIDVNLRVNENSEEYCSFTPLHFAVHYYCPNAVKILLKYGANVHLKNSSGYSSLHSIIGAKFKISRDDEKVRDRYERTLNNFVKFFIDHNGDVSSVDEFGFCKLHAACLLEDPSDAKGLLGRNTNINQAVNSDSPICPGYTVLHLAATYNFEIFELLVKKGADIGVKNATGLTPFDLLLHNCKVEQILTILSIKSEWKNIVFSDKETKLLDVVSAFESNEKWVSLFTSKKSVLKSHVPTTSPLWPGYTLLHLAVAYDKEKWEFLLREKNKGEPISLCLQAGADMTVKNANSWTPLHLAFYLQKHHLLEYLLNNDTQSINPADDGQLSHFHIACAVQHVQAVELLLLKKCVDVNSQVLSTFKCPMKFAYITPGSTALHITVNNNWSEEIVKKLLKYGADVNAQDANGFTPVHWLLFRFTGSKIVKLLFSHKNLKNITTPYGLSHLHVASYFGQNDAIIKLLKLGADVNAHVMYDKYDCCVKNYVSNDVYVTPGRPLAFLSKYAGHTPLHFPKDSLHETRLLLIERNADVFAKNRKGTFPLQKLLEDLNAHDGYSKIINENIDIQTFLKNEYGITMLHVNCFSANIKLVQNLLKNGEDVNAKVNSRSTIWRGYTPLHCVMEKLLKKNKDIFLVDKLKKIGQLLVEHGADVLLEDDNHDTPFHMIYQKLDLHEKKYEADALLKAFPLVLLLFENLKNFKVNPINNNGLSLFHIACIVFHVDVVRKFLQSGVDVNRATRYFSRNCPESTALHLVIMIYHVLNKNPWALISQYDKAVIEVVDLLLEHGANVNAVDFRGSTPLLYVIELNSIRPILMKKLISHGADVHAIDERRRSVFELLMKQKNDTWEDLKVFLEASPNFFFNMYNPVTHQGYLGTFFRYHQDFHRNVFKTLLDKPMILRVINHSNIIEISSSGRSVIHNIVSLMPICKITKKPLIIYGGIGKILKPLFEEKREKYLFYKEVIEQLVTRGCDIDQQDNEGKTALHLAMEFGNYNAVVELLRNGADINITDNHGKTAYYYFTHKEELRCCFPYKQTVVVAYIRYIHKLKYCGLYVNEQNDDPEELEVMEEEYSRFHHEMNKTKNMKIGKTSFSLYEFLMTNDMGAVYMNMKFEERQEVDQFFENMVAQNFSEIGCLLKLKYKKTIEKKKLFCPALEALNTLMKNQLPDLCAHIVFKSLNNQDLKRLIASVE